MYQRLRTVFSFIKAFNYILGNGIEMPATYPFRQILTVTLSHREATTGSEGACREKELQLRVIWLR